MKRTLILSLLFSFAYTIHAHEDPFITRFEKSKGTESTTYDEAIKFYDSLDVKYDRIKMLPIGLTDTKYTLNAVIYSKDQGFNIKQWKQEGKVIIFVNNGIHAGEPDGIDASMMLMRDAANGKINVPDNVVLVVIPLSNIGGSLNRNSDSRTNQNGPKEYGTRANPQNLDLNRDFIKLDSKEIKSLATFYYQVDPDIFIDNHVSDGADYQHVITLLASQHDKLGGAVGSYMYSTIVPDIYKDMKKRGYDLVPYVNEFRNTPDSGWTEFYDPPRFSSGFAALFHAFSFVTETHMLKPFKQRVEGTYDLMLSFIDEASKNANAIHSARYADVAAIKAGAEVPLDWKADTTKHDMITFKGYTAGYKPSQVSGQPRLYYDRSKPYTKQIPYYNHFIPTVKVKSPKAYVIPQCWVEVLARLNLSGVNIQKIKNDTTIEVDAYHIDSYETVPHPYEKHYLHKNVVVTKGQKHSVQFMTGDYIVPVEQTEGSLALATLEPQAPDSYFAWGFFDGILQQKEYYSSYVFEDEAAKMLESDASLRKLLENKKRLEPAFAKDPAAQLDFIYQYSPHYEHAVNMYPVYRIEP